MRHRQTPAATIVTFRSAFAAGLCVGVIWPAALRAQTAPPANDEPVRLDQMMVLGDAVPGLYDAAPASSAGLPPSLATTVADVPGLAMHHMGAAAAEPLLRGLGSDRVVTTLDGLPLPNASPTRTDSPLALIGGGLIAGFEVSKAVPSVTLGPPANAGYIALALAPGSGAGQTNLSYANTEWDFDRNGSDVLAGATGRSHDWSYRAAGAAHSLGNYTAGDGTVVPAEDRNEGTALELGWQPDPHHRLQLGALFSRQELAVNSALPLDTRATDTMAMNVEYDWAGSDQTRIATRFGVGLTDPHLDNRGRPAPALVTADGRTLSLAAGVSARHETAGGDEVAIGVDATQEERRMERHRPGAVDLLWPDLYQQDLGGYAEYTRKMTPDWKLRLGARLDTVKSEAREADGLAFNRIIRDLYVAYNGPAAAQTNQDEPAGAANVLLTGQLATGFTTSLGAGFSRQPTGATERYRAFSDALGGGYEIGNPTARTEDKYELDWGLHWQRQTFSVNVDLFGSYLPDYLYRTVVGRTTPPAPPPPGAVVYGYRAIEADFWGGEMNLLWQPAQDSWFQLTGASVAATDRDAHHQLPEIPPATLAFAAGHAWSGMGLKPWIEFGLRYTASRNNPAPGDMPVFANTSAFTFGSLQAGFSWRRIRISCAVENLFNRNYHEYLSPPAAGSPASGDLIPGTRIPGPGRSVLLMISYRGR
jgi:iron complex outermembrane receptor protein